jgi:hypothetical protein
MKMEVITENRLKGAYIAQHENALYQEVVSLNYARKANDTFEIDIYTTDVNKVSPMCRFYLYMLPIVEKTWNDWMQPDGFDREQQFFVIKDGSNYYLTDMQGYDYLRYVTKLENFNPEAIEEDDSESELIDRGTGLTRIGDHEIFENVISNMCHDLSADGFSKKDALIFLQVLLDHKFDCVVESRKYLFNND